MASAFYPSTCIVSYRKKPAHQPLGRRRRVSKERSRYERLERRQAPSVPHALYAHVCVGLHLQEAVT